MRVQIWRWAAGYTKMMLQFCILFVITTHLVCAASLRVSGVRRCPRTFWKAESLYFTSITMNLSELQTSRSRGHVAVSQNVKFQDIRNLHRFSLVVIFTLVINSRTNETRFPGAGTSWLRKNKCTVCVASNSIVVCLVGWIETTVTLKDASFEEKSRGNMRARSDNGTRCGTNVRTREMKVELTLEREEWNCKC